MCRFIAFAGLAPLVDSLLPCIDSFVRSAERDPLLRAISRRGAESHGDGWGYAVAGRGVGGSLSTGFYRSSAPVYRDPKGVESLKSMVLGLDTYMGVAHARLASRNEPLGVENAHPFMIEDPGRGFTLWLAHNGSVRKEELARELGLGDLVSRRTDSFFLAHYIARELSSADPAGIVRAIEAVVEKGFVKTALNLGILIAGDPGVFLVVTSLYPVGDPGRERYYKVYMVCGERLFVAGSSTIFEVYTCGDPGEARELCNGCAVAAAVRDGRVSTELYELPRPRA